MSVSVSVSQVLGCDPEALLRAASDLGSAASQVDSQIAAERTHLSSLAADWTGTSSEIAREHADEMIADQVTYRSTLSSLHAELSATGRDLGRHRSELAHHVTSAEAQFFDVSDDGSASLGTKLRFLTALSPVLAVTFSLRRLALQTAIQTALRQFDAADRAAAAALRRIDES